MVLLTAEVITRMAWGCLFTSFAIVFRPSLCLSSCVCGLLAGWKLLHLSWQPLEVVVGAERVTLCGSVLCRDMCHISGVRWKPCGVEGVHTSIGRCWHSCGHVNSFFVELGQHLHCSPWVFVPPAWQHGLSPWLLCFGRISMVFLSLALQNNRCPGYLHRLCSIWSAFLCAINTLSCINFEMSLLISSSNNLTLSYFTKSRLFLLPSVQSGLASFHCVSFVSSV